MDCNSPAYWALKTKAVAAMIDYTTQMATRVECAKAGIVPPPALPCPFSQFITNVQQISPMRLERK